MDQFLEKLDRIARERAGGAESAHDYLHVQRVFRNTRRIGDAEQADLGVVLPAALLHELFNYPKGHPDSAKSGEVCADHARAVLHEVEAPPAIIEPVCYAIKVHPFSLGITPETLEAKVLQDADRLDAIGAIGIARCFASSAEMKRPFYNPNDPFCETRAPDDKQWGVDHFFKKLLKIPERLHTETARKLAEARVEFMRDYLEQLQQEIGNTEL